MEENITETLICKLKADGPGSGDCSEDTGHSGQLDNDEK